MAALPRKPKPLAPTPASDAFIAGDKPRKQPSAMSTPFILRLPHDLNGEAETRSRLLGITKAELIRRALRFSFANADFTRLEEWKRQP